MKPVAKTFLSVMIAACIAVVMGFTVGPAEAAHKTRYGLDQYYGFKIYRGPHRPQKTIVKRYVYHPHYGLVIYYKNRKFHRQGYFFTRHYKCFDHDRECKRRVYWQKWTRHY